MELQFKTRGSCRRLVRTIKHRSHENIMPWAIDKRDMPQELHLGVLKALRSAGWVVLFAASVCL